jgi:hypothetical protein
MKVSSVGAMAIAFAFGAVAAVSAGPLEAHAAGPVASYVLAPSPIAPAGSLAASATVAVTLTAEDSTTAPVSGATVFLTFKHSKTGGGSALVGTTALTLKAQQFVTDANGHIAITYHTPSTLLTNGEDVITAQNTASLPTIRVTDHYIFNDVTRYKMNPHPIAATNTLAGNTTKVVTLTALNSSGAGVPSAVVYLSFIQAAGGGSAAVGTTALTITPQAFTANTSGVISITYKTPAAPPTSGIDTIKAKSAPTHTVVAGSDTYTF